MGSLYVEFGGAQQPNIHSARKSGFSGNPGLVAQPDEQLLSRAHEATYPADSESQYDREYAAWHLQFTEPAGGSTGLNRQWLSARPFSSFACISFENCTLFKPKKLLKFSFVLQVLKLDHNQITYVSQDITLLQQLRILDLSYNRLNSLPQVRTNLYVPTYLQFVSLRTLLLRTYGERTIDCGKIQDWFLNDQPM